MKKLSVFFVFMCAIIYGNAQVSVYVKITLNSGSLIDENPSSATHKGQILLTTTSGGIQQLATNFSASGAGSVKVIFNPITFSKPASINSALLFQICASGSRLKTVEISYYDSNDKIIYKQTLTNVFISSDASTAASCASGCPGIIENISLDYGREVISTYSTPGGTSTSYGWDYATNMPYNDPS